MKASKAQSRSGSRGSLKMRIFHRFSISCEALVGAGCIDKQLGAQPPLICDFVGRYRSFFFRYLSRAFLAEKQPCLTVQECGTQLKCKVRAWEHEHVWEAKSKKKKIHLLHRKANERTRTTKYRPVTSRIAISFCSGCLPSSSFEL